MPTFQTARLHLREFNEEDWRDVLAYQQDPSYLKYYPWLTRTEEDVRRFVQSLVEQRLASVRVNYHFAVCLRGESRLIGIGSIRLKAADSLVADIGYELSPRHWGNGYATEAASQLLRFGFAQLRLHRIWAKCNAENRASAQVLEKIGMAPEGRLREDDLVKGVWYDTLTYGILENEWRAEQTAAEIEAIE